MELQINYTKKADPCGSAFVTLEVLAATERRPATSTGSLRHCSGGGTPLLQPGMCHHFGELRMKQA